MFNEVVWEELEGHSQVLVSIKWHFEIHVFYIGPTEFGSWRTDYTVLHYFCRDHTGCACRELVWIIDKDSANRDPYLIWVVFLGAVVDDNLCVHDRSIFRDASDFIVCEVEDCVGANLDIIFALCKAMQLL